MFAPPARTSAKSERNLAMGSLSPIHWVIIAVLLLLLFGGRGKLSGLMGDAAKGIRAFRDGLKGDEATPAPPQPPPNRCPSRWPIRKPTRTRSSARRARTALARRAESGGDPCFPKGESSISFSWA